MRVLLACLVAWGVIGATRAADWLANSVVAEGSTSPDGRYGILIDDQGRPGDETVETIAHVADLKAHRILGRIKANCSAGMSLSVLWSSDASWAVVTYGVRDGFRSVELLQPFVSGVKETALGERIRTDADGISAGPLHAFVREGAQGQIEIRATGTNDPKGRRPKPTFVYFQGCYDPASSAWMNAKTRACSEKEWEELSAAFASSPKSGTETVEEKTDRLDSQLNKIYTGLHRLLPVERFSALREEQRQWLAGVGKGNDLAKENLRTEARVAVLEKLLWSL